tara:strand:- start:153 stop:494 length:342 start_codon:yes stop_codon:yes gene_type:complete
MDDLNAALRLMSDGDQQATIFITKDQNFGEKVRTWEILGVDAWKGFEEDDVENDPVTPGMPAFEVKTSSINGVGLFATRNIKKGTEIFRGLSARGQDDYSVQSAYRGCGSSSF